MSDPKPSLAEQVLREAEENVVRARQAHNAELEAAGKKAATATKHARDMTPAERRSALAAISAGKLPAFDPNFQPSKSSTRDAKAPAAMHAKDMTPEERRKALFKLTGSRSAAS